MTAHQFDDDRRCETCGILERTLSHFPFLLNRCRPSGGRTNELTERQSVALAFIRAEIEAGRGFPSSGKISKHLNLATSQSSTDLVRRLIVKGHVIRHTSRTGKATYTLTKEKE